jgi:hypothetical protein
MNNEKKIVANKLNARRSSGPRTAIGKSNSRRNAAKHGLFSQELLFSDIEKAEFQALHRSLQSQLQPTTALQRVALEEILCCTWRCKLATRQEMQHLRALLDIPRDGEAEPEEPRASAAMTKWFGSGRRELNEGIRILKALEQVVRLKGRVPEEWKERLDRAFGVEFYESLVNCKRLTNTPVRRTGCVLECPNDRKNGVVSAQATYTIGGPAVGGRVCEQRYAAERVLPESRFELQHTGSPSEKTALEEKA